MSTSKLRNRKSLDGINYWVAVHEASHAVANWQLAKELGGNFPWFDRVFVRTPAEVDAGLYVDDRGRSDDILGAVEGKAFYNPVTMLVCGQKGSMLTIERGDNMSEADFKKFMGTQRALMEAEAVSRLAGPAGEALYLRVPKWMFWHELAYCNGSDWRTASCCVWEFSSTDDDFDKTMNRVQRKAAGLVRQHWSAIAALADALMVRHSLTVEEALPIMETATTSQAIAA
ncbi:hypothetical protein GALL_243280 [mine drainage metagenome]|uniref:Uncharacterized protein n=1 Tax=mine drainage metagenome TaxID=410659 RepID=A0A1J5RCB9_9ZZZZ